MAGGRCRLPGLVLHRHGEAIAVPGPCVPQVPCAVPYFAKIRLPVLRLRRPLAWQAAVAPATAPAARRCMNQRLPRAVMVQRGEVLPVKDVGERRSGVGKLRLLNEDAPCRR